jgi:ATP-dependent Clp protease ATP-binding subunit ClpX
MRRLGSTGFGMPGRAVRVAPEESAGGGAGESVADVRQRIFDFKLRPRDIKEHLDRFVIRQDEAKKALAIAVCDHYNHAKYLRAAREDESIELQKQNVIIVGPTGVGKTYLVKHIAELIGVPFVKADATKFSETGYVGGDVDDLVRELVQKAGGDIELAEHGIIYIDEIDKLASSGTPMGRDVSGRGVQTTLLKLMEETEVPLRNPMDIRGQMQAMMDLQRGSSAAARKESINTRHILFIVSGAFSGLEKVVRRRLRSGQIGFGADLSEQPMDEEMFRHIRTQDFIEFGFEAEFIGRLPVRVVCERLSAADFEDILNFSEGSLLRQYEREFAAYGIRARFDAQAIHKIAQQAEGEGTGARALMTVCERLLRDFKFELPGTAVSELLIDAELVDHTVRTLEHYRELGQRVDVEKARKEADLFAEDFRKEHGVEVFITDEALAALVHEAATEGRSVLQLCEQRFHDYQFGLKLIQKNTRCDRFELPVEAVANPDKFLSDLVVQSYRREAQGRA